MKTLLAFWALFLAASPLRAAPAFNPRMAVQGYLKSGSTALNTGSYSMRFVIKNNGAAVWTKTYAGGSKVAVVDGVFTQILSGADDSAVPLSASMMNVAASSHVITVDVTVNLDNTAIGSGTDATYTDLDLVPVPMAMLAQTATALSQNGATDGQFLRWNNASGGWEPATLSTSTIPTGSIGSGQLASGSVVLTASTVSGVLPYNKGGTGLSTRGTGNQLYGMNAAGNGAEYKSITAGAGIAVNHTAGGIQISTSGTGTVTEVTATAPISVATGTSTPALSLAAGSGAGQVLRWDGTSAWAAAKLGYGDLVNSLAASPWPASCPAGQFVIWSSAADAFACAAIDLSSTALTNQLPLSKGGTGADLTAVNGGVVYSTGSAMAVSAAGAAGQVLKSNGAAAPTWATIQQASSRSQINLFEDYMVGLNGGANTSAIVGSSLWTAATGAGTLAHIVSPAAGSIGTARILTGTTNGAFAALGFCGQGAVGNPTYNMRFETGDTWTYEVRFSVSSTAASTGLLRFGLVSGQSATAGNPMGAYMEIAAGGTTVTAYTKDAGGSQSGLTSTIAASTINRWTIAWDGAKVRYFKDGTEIGTGYGTNIATGQSLCPGVFDAAGTLSRNIEIDYIAYSQTTASR